MWLTAGLVFITTLWIAGLLLSRAMTPRLVTVERLSGFVRPVRAATSVAGARWSGIPSIDRAMAGLHLGRDLERLLDAADTPVKPFEFLLIVAVSGLVLAVLGLAVTRTGLVVVPAAILGAGAPFLWLLLKRNRRREAFNRQLPDALTALAGALRVGLGLNQGITMVASDHPYPISAEFARAQREMNLGLGIDEVLQNMAVRLRSADFDLAVAGILINRQVGGNLAELLDQVAATLRERVRLKNFIRVLTAQQRLSAIIIVLVPPILMVILFLGLRDYTEFLVTTQIGHVMLIISVVLQLLGIYFIRRIVGIEV
ncbi:MAG TPA: type II secretion system F family protein [bacterium]|nr:type II secretion system F family protein [bacterium]